MALNTSNDIEMNPLGRLHSSAGTSSFTAHGGRSPSDTRPSSSRTGPHRNNNGTGGGGMQARFNHFIDSFRREDGTGRGNSSSRFSIHANHADDHTTHDEPFSSGPPAVRDHHGERYYDLHTANTKTASTLLARELKGRHLQMIAISGSIGTGLFVASGKALSQGGPASVLLAYLVVGVMLWCTVQALGEMAVVFPVAGSFAAYSTRFLDPSWGFAMGWNYALQWIVVLPLEIIAGALTIGYWNPALDPSIFVTIFLFVIVLINLAGIKGYGEAEFIFAIVKVTAVVGFIIADASASPFVIAIESAGATILPSIMNGVILVSVISVGNSSVFGSSRTLAALAEQGQAPRIFAYVDRRGRPLVAVLAVSAVGPLAYLANSDRHGPVFDWLLAVSGLSTVFTWASTCLAHVRLRKAWAYRRREVGDMPFKAQAGVLGSWVGFVCNCVVLVAQVWVAIAPLPRDDGGEWDVSSRAQNFFVQCLALPVVLVFWLGHKLWFRTGFVRVEDMDIDTGRRDFGRLGTIKAQEQEERQSWPKWKRFYRFIC
ncbi:amino acid permease-domain-containing protein [Chaetomium tenue]|uniref:Amino acid permease-domain-containing protein n=1 Tax=Chaetomium tenue TaxID=1854479 RepID=A0ACB7P001_9PEZI|nr:amino acid permease-domain-containing protein [Chaetomium globosum]